MATLTVFVHVGREALVQSTCPALIAMGFVDRAAIFQIALRFASVHSIPVDGTFEEPGTTCNIRHRNITTCLLKRTKANTNVQLRDGKKMMK